MRNRPCSRNPEVNSNYCWQHKKDKTGTIKKCILALNKNNLWLTAISIIASLLIAAAFYFLGIKQAIILAQESTNDTLWLTSPVILNVTHYFDENEGRVYINVTNTHPLKRTGAIYLYKLEIDPNKPESIYERGLNPGETFNYSLTFNVNHTNITYTGGATLVKIPVNLLYYVSKHTSISYKIICDNCPAQGIIRRIPDFSKISLGMGTNNKGIKFVDVPVYTWVDYSLKDVATS